MTRTKEEIIKSSIKVTDRYAIELYESFIRITDLAQLNKVVIFTDDGTLCGPTMSDYEIKIAYTCLKENNDFIQKKKRKLSCALLGNIGHYTLFSFKDLKIKMCGGKDLEYYDNIVTWDHGLITVMTKYRHSAELIEEYVDIESALIDFGFNSDAILMQIKEVRIGKLNKYGELIEQ